ncbi:hypothetical protein [Lysinibacillus sphaericus]|uniref:Uncharacterized protein n=2 Tax=Lysinibacillus sphaericus TaxID=1421 RepID=A0A6H0A0K5_LYSSH|nr:hypothetical protein [Lysinibacillus sphaericus]MBE5085711.1 hypothetical protein [Bacillus thuringiensis]AMO35422.1 hypothetical protein AR327_23305 [Lysinibacillus sphaericus]AMR93145.1 hypothetical protein A1T07_23350 [Lysinibacillus sphaericus]MBG9710674.1 hypothetical protein [Lysinibacillus sphaericus]MBG9730417.1 hypothetical protein [Lysinibacillus sphaericus]
MSNLMTPFNLFVLNNINKNIYNGNSATSDKDPLGKLLFDFIKTFGGWGTAIFTLAVMVLAICLMITSPSPRMRTVMWTGLLVCACAAAIFFSAYFIGPGFKNYF